MCRICLSDEETETDPIITPCRCAGSMRYIHHECLQNWFKQKMFVHKSTFVDTYFWSSLECELCKAPYPTEIQHSDLTLKVIDFEIP